MGTSSRLRDQEPDLHTPPRHGPASASAGWEKGRRRLVSLRESLYRRRLSLKEKRNEIREERIYADELVAKLLSAISRSWESGGTLDDTLIRNLHKDLLSKRDELGALQFDYDQAEEDYDDAEEQLNEQEDDQGEAAEDSLSENTTQSIRNENEARAKGYGEHLNVLVGLKSQSQPKGSLSSTQLYQVGSHASSASIYRENINTTLDHMREPSTKTHFVKRDAEHDILEATFLIRPHPTPRSHDGRSDQIVRGSPTPNQVREGPQLQPSNIRWEGASARGPEPTTAQYLVSRSKARSDSGVTTLRRGLIRRKSRITWWLFDTFGSSFADYVERARDKQQSREFEDLDDETWARLVYGYWTGKRILKPAIPSMGEGRSSTDIAEPRHVEQQSLGGSYLLLPPGLSELRHSVYDVDRLFPQSRSSPDVPKPMQGFESDLSDLLTLSRPP